MIERFQMLIGGTRSIHTRVRIELAPNGVSVMMDTDKKLQASKVIAAPADDIFALLSDPNQHTVLDGAGMIQGVEGETPPISGIGQVFTMNMHADDLGDYRMVNSVTAFVPGARVGWAPKVDPTCELAEKLGGMDTSGHTFTYDLRVVEDGVEVTSTYDWTGVKDAQFEAMFPRVSQEQLAGTLDKLSAAVS